MNTANWIPDLFMKRVMEGGDWTLFSPQRRARPARPLRPRLRGALRALRSQGRARARSSCSRRSRPSTCGARCSPCCSRPAIPGSPSRTPATSARRSTTSASCTRSNLCTEITLNTSDDEIAVCNLGSVILVTAPQRRTASTTPSSSSTIRTAMRMLDNVIDINFYPTSRRRATPTCGTARSAWASWASRTACTSCGIPYAIAEARRVRRRLDGGRLPTTPTGPPPTWPPSAAATPASRARSGTAASCRRTPSTCCEKERGGYRRGGPLQPRWTGTPLRARIASTGMRNSNCPRHRAHRDHLQHHRRLASIEPTYKNLFVKSNLSRRVHRRQRVPGARPQGPRPVGRGHDRRTSSTSTASLQRHRPHPGRPEGALRHRLRDRRRAGWSRPPRAARNGSTRRSR